MQYMLMCCINEAQWENTSQSQRDGIMREYNALVKELVNNGRYVVGAKLQSTASAATVRGKNCKAAVTDGPFAETKEQLGGYHVVECANMEEAVSIAQRIPTIAVGGIVEVRPVEEATH